MGLDQISYITPFPLYRLIKLSKIQQNIEFYIRITMQDCSHYLYALGKTSRRSI